MNWFEPCSAGDGQFNRVMSDLSISKPIDRSLDFTVPCRNYFFRWVFVEMTKRFDVYGIGNALVDTEIEVSDEVLIDYGLMKGSMTLVTDDKQSKLLAALSGYKQIKAAGGSSANTMVGISLFGGSTCFTGKIGDDPSGAFYGNEMDAQGVKFIIDKVEGPTGVCVVLVTPDGERTLQTSLGASITLKEGDIRSDWIENSQFIYLESYLWGSPVAAQTAEAAVCEAINLGTKVALSFSDTSMTEAFGAELARVTRGSVDVVFCNETEAKSYSQSSDRMEALTSIGRDCPLVFMTCGGDGSLISDNGQIFPVTARRVTPVDTTGAGDAYAAGVLYGLTHALTSVESAKLGTYAAAKVVMQIGPRLGQSLTDQIASIIASE